MDGRSVQTGCSYSNRKAFGTAEASSNGTQLIKITLKVKNAVEMSPCIVDYAVNFGVANTQIQWRKHLLNSDNSLAAPILMMTGLRTTK